MLKVSNINCKLKDFGRSFTLSNVEFELEDGYIMALVGETGAGKTTLLNVLYGVIPDKKAQISYGDVSLSRKNLSKYRENIAYVGQEKWCLSSRTILQNIEFMSIIYPDLDINFLTKLLNDWGFSINASTTYDFLSTGMQKQFQVAAALARRPKLMLMDEPFANLDVVVKKQMMEAIQNAIAEYGMTAIISTHLLHEIEDVADYVGVIKDGKMIKFGDTTQVAVEE